MGLVGMVVWVRPGDGRPNRQRGRIEAIGALHCILTMLGDGEVEMRHIKDICGIEIDDKTMLMFDITEFVTES